eukprot:TRINITY_DN3962_c0_g1_i2.p1 TRINITY_DN3962_c0_g1~~TRINITY_DN3962_c0_g1_i2.p1  ORF type:complete len:405 (+),score=166.95 TRINITY_DN3962_c0_g1_i2:101-1216(+)
MSQHHDPAMQARQPLRRSHSSAGRRSAHGTPQGAPRSARSARSQSPGAQSRQSIGMASTATSRYEANQSMRERAAALWLDQLRHNHDRRRAAAQRSSEIAELQRVQTLQKIAEQDSQLQRSQQANAEYRSRRTEAFVERQQYLQAAKQHAEILQEHRAQQIEHEHVEKLRRGDELHAQAVTQRAVSAADRNHQRMTQAARNQEMLDQYKAERDQTVLMQEAEARDRVAELRAAEEAERLRRREEKEAALREAAARHQRLSEHHRQRTERKLTEDDDRAARVLQSRQEYLRERAQQQREREAQVAAQVAHAQALRKSKEREWEQHFEESVAIGRETAEHNRLFKLNNRIMHQLMAETAPPRLSRGSSRRSGR